ncbi:MAG: lysogenization regulator HflD [Lysobacteraceae bacterium SCN 69-123]|jgi:high frequency lysogenization protein|uniref:high frequency lysogenization protein HflD n=1 Tax=Stenotrophomonas acidaminiphila TaxID=128780 RepID=UPI00086A8A5B|nr:high frequency lysogenization protein HflD [Stenotrophomonas acidaminiphila]MBN8801922.1 high frequency lysogenization protein HflD [Stenotrophomonas acidaminiphila]MDF9441328.1 lysogenization regulator HflD [Stenotrophomonas acidaminiphila]ODU41940.1 MAG: lysogenization regulator HflD [Xanthomonadaceae bacterium SCN 69-123]OJY75637.1 MAG: lysogenization regulator HflD [Stenotrophomonas sp. 69-14]
MSSSFDDRVLALAGIAQALQQVRRIAETGHSDNAVVRTAMDSVMRIDAPSPAAVYGDSHQLEPGLRLLRDYFGNQGKDALLPRLALSVMQLERRFVRERATVDKVQAGIERAAAQARELGDPAHPEVLGAMGGLYADTISQLKPRIMVQGNPHYLGQAGVVAEIRALLLAAVRSAVLWRQLGGSYWDFLFSRKAMLEAISRRLRGGG